MAFIAKRLCITVITLFFVSILSFAAFRLIPGDPALLALGPEATEEQLSILRSEMGLERSLPVQYVMWLGRFFSGRLGSSARFMGASISALILERLPVTLSLAALSFLFTLAIAVPVSVFSAKREHSLVDRVVTGFTAIGISVPGFFLGILFIWIFGLTLQFFTPGAYVCYTESTGAFLSYLIFPALAIAVPNAALLVKFFKTSIFREFQSDYARTAKSKGANRPEILRRHVAKNASLPLITLLGMIAAEILSGSIIIEQVFGIPGIGRLLITSISSRDYPVIEVLIIYIAFAVVFANTLADIVLQIVDPRIRLSKRV
jgi:peptide/nickel transport system permease protein